MTENPDKQPESPTAFDPRIQTEKLAFDPKELVSCGGCGRTNPPNRLKCLYCARELEIRIENTEAIRPILRKLEIWERVWNVIVREIGSQADTGKIAQFLSMDAADLTAILDAGTPLPLARVESEREAAILLTRMERLGLKCMIVSDADLAADKPPVRLGRIDLPNDRIELKDFNTGKTTEVESDDLVLIVPGLITARRVDTLEKKRRRGQKKLLDETTTATDETILDIYSRHDRNGYRVHLAGFDFSCLGEDKGLLAVENLRRLVVALKEHAPNAKLVNDYTSVRHALGNVWEIESRSDPQGLQRAGFGKVEFGNVASTSNLMQFTKYSRLQWHLL